jgi:hypothetical protein
MQCVAGPAADGVDDDIQSPEPIQNLGYCPLRVSLIGDISRNRNGFRTSSPNTGRRRLRSLSCTVNDRHRCAGFRQSGTNR